MPSTSPPFASAFDQERSQDDVRWHIWSAETQKATASQTKPILLFIGYYGCGWTRDLAQSCFRRADIASVIMAETFPVALDAQVWPHLDMAYQASAQAMGLEGGWPLVLFCTPTGLPIGAALMCRPTPHRHSPALPTSYYNSAKP
ncbi:MAG: DUF255 domain-containing protein [Pseudomonadota bacterium]